MYKIKRPGVAESGVYKFVVRLLHYETEEGYDVNIVPKGMAGPGGGRMNSLGSLGSLLSINGRSKR